MSAVGDTHGNWRVVRVYWLDEDGEDIGEPAVEWVEVRNTQNPGVASRCLASDLPALGE